MITGSLERRPDGGTLQMFGHAPRQPDAAKTGNKLCAAVSFLTKLTASALDHIAGADVENCVEESGVTMFSWSGGEAERVYCVLDMFCLGCRLIERNYPGTIAIDGT